MAKKLVLGFMSEQNVKANVIINNIREDVALPEIQKVMNDIISTQVLTHKGFNLVSKESAIVVDTTENVIDLES